MSASAPRPRPARSLAATVAIAPAVVAVITGCGTDGLNGPDAGLRLELDGWLERNQRIQVRVFEGDRALRPGEFEMAFEPQERATRVDEETLHLDEAGSLTLEVSTSSETLRRDFEVAVPPSIVFDMMRDGNRDVWRVALDGRDLDRLTSHPADDRQPSVAGGGVVFVSNRDGNAELYRLTEEGDLSRLTQTAVREGAPALSPDGTDLAYTSDASGVPEVWLAAADGSGAGPATSGFGFGGSVEDAPSWAPAGDRIVFMSTNAGTADLYGLVPHDGAVTEMLADPASPEVEPSWSPSGEAVVFASERAGRTDLYSLSLSGGTITRLTDRAEADGQPSFLADGRIVYVAWVSGVPELRWLDPERPARVHAIETGPGEPRNPAGWR